MTYCSFINMRLQTLLLQRKRKRKATDTAANDGDTEFVCDSHMLGVLEASQRR